LDFIVEVVFFFFFQYLFIYFCILKKSPKFPELVRFFTALCFLMNWQSGHYALVVDGLLFVYSVFISIFFYFHNFVWFIKVHKLSSDAVNYS